MVFTEEKKGELFLLGEVLLWGLFPVVTLPAAFFVLGELPTLWQVLGLIPILAGVKLLSDFWK